jgi:hypothetical protein
MASDSTGSASSPADPAPHGTDGPGAANGARETRGAGVRGRGRSTRHDTRPRRASWRAWRRSRPFWGGLLLTLAGLEMLLIPLTGVLARGQIKLVIYVGVGGIFGILIGGLLVACGLALWFNQAHKTFYAIAGLLLAVLSFIGTNLGGFFIGMLLGIVGGSLAFGWTPIDAAGSGASGPPRRAHPPSEETDPGFAAAAPSLDDPRHRSRDAGRFLAVLVILVMAAATLMTGHAPAAETATGRSSSGPGCILLIICPTSPSAPATPSPSASPAGGTPPLPGILPSPGGSGLVPGVPGSGGETSGTSPGNRAANNKAAAPAQGFVAASPPSAITASSATLDGLSYRGTVSMPVNGGGTIKMMKFTMNSQALSGLTLTATGAGSTLVTTAAAATFAGNVVLYATRLSGKLLGLTLTLTPGNAESTLLQVLNTLTPLVPITMTNVTADEPVVLGNSAAVSGLAVTAS